METTLFNKSLHRERDKINWRQREREKRERGEEIQYMGLQIFYFKFYHVLLTNTYLRSNVL